MDSYLVYIFLLGSLIQISLSQLTSTDLNYIKKTVTGLQDEKSGLFSNSVQSTYKAILVLKGLDMEISHVPKICRELNYALVNGNTAEISDLNTILSCKIDEAPYTKAAMNPNFNLNELFNFVDFSSKFGMIAVGRADFRKLLETFKIKENKLFSNTSDETRRASLLSTSHGLRILSILYEVSDPEEKDAIKKDLHSITKNLLKEFQNMNDETGLFIEAGVSSLYLNSEILEALERVHKISPIDNFFNTEFKMLNYFLTFKYEYTNLENIFNLVKALDNLAHIPIIYTEKKSFDYIEEKQIPFRLINGVGSDYELKENKAVQISYRIRSIDTDDTELPMFEKLTLKNIIFNLDLQKKIKSPGKYSIEFKGEENLTYSYSYPINAFSKVKVNHLKMTVTRTQDNIDEKDITVEYPKRSFKNIKATQNSIIKLKVKINYGDNQSSKIEQIFLRLKNNEIGKAYSSYVTDLKQVDDYYLINFDMSDPNTMEAYDGLYELTLILSDTSLENPIIWNFGKIEIRFKKPLDPNNLVPSYKNPQGDRIEPTIPEPENPNKNFVVK